MWKTVTGILSADRRPISAKDSPMTHLSLIILICLSLTVTGSLVTGDFCGDGDTANLSALDDSIWNYWETAAIRSDDRSSQKANVTTETFFRFCRPLGNDSGPGCAGANVCVVRTMSNGSVLVDTYMTKTLIVSTHSMQLSLVSNQTCGLGLPHEKRIHVDFYCDHSRGLGRPFKLVTQYCITTFNWPTIAACRSVPKHPILSKCFVYDDDGQIRDLSPLIAPDGHVVSSAAHDEVGRYIVNICSEVNQSCHTPKSSSSGTSVCFRDPNGSHVQHFGDVRKSAITYDEKSDEVVIQYSSTLSTTCPTGPFVSLIRLRCPQTRAEFSYYGLESRKPFILQKTDCNLVIEWQTDYACPIHQYEQPISSNSCGIQVDGTFLDLKPLSRNGSYFIGNVSSGNETLDVILNVCDSLTSDSLRSDYCHDSDWSSDRLCMRSKSRGTIMVATMINAKLTYADGNVFLSYPVKQNLNCSGQSKAIITFICDLSAGDGQPSFTSFYDCVLSIHWKTSRVCLPVHLMPPACSVQSDSGALFDLSPLRRNVSQSMWSASLVDYKHSSLLSHKPVKIQLNVCGDVSKPVIPGSTRIEKSSVQLTDSTSSSFSLGQFTSAPTIHPDSQKLMLVYNVTHEYNGSAKNVVTSIILFSCAPGIVESIPKLTDVSVKVVSPNETHTNYTFEWRTGAACPLTRTTGSDCVVVDRNLGLKFDLNPLHEEQFGIRMVHGKSLYMMNICGALEDSGCREKDVGVCSDASGKNVSLGQFSRNVTYWNGILTLHYGNGARLGPNASAASSDIFLVCDEADTREPEMISEQNNTHTFRMYTKHACPDMENVVPCVWENGTHAVDLSMLSNATGNDFTVLFDPEKRESTVYYYSFCRPLLRLNQEESNCREGSAACKVVMKNGVAMDVLSMGIPRDPPALYPGHDYLSLIYTNGDDCPTNKSARMNFVIKFVCAEEEGHGIDQKVRRFSEDGCIEEIEFHTALVCHVFPFAGNSSDPSLPNSASHHSSHSTSIFAVVVVSLLVLVALLMAAAIIIGKPENRSRVIDRLRSLVCRDLVPADPIHYSQLQSGGRDLLSFISAAGSSPYNATTVSISDTAPVTSLMRLSRTRESRDSSEDTVHLIQ